MDYDVFREQYEKMHPASIPREPVIVSDYPGWLTYLAALMFLAVSVVSGVHTVSTMRYTMIESMVIAEGLKDYAALAAFFGFEVALFVSVFGWLRKDNRWIAYAATFVVFVVIVLANVQDIARASDGNVFNGIMIFGIGIGTPLVALFSGKLFVDIYRRRLVNEQNGQTHYAAELKAWDERIERVWKREQKKLKRTSDKVSASVRSVSETKKRTDASAIVREHLQEHPEDRELSVRSLAEKLNVGRTTAHTVLGEFQSNGHQ